MEEIWRPISGHDGYEVSSLGNVRSIEREITLVYKSGKVSTRHYKGKILTPQYDGLGHYLHVQLGKNTIKNVHRLVAEAFVENPMGYTEVNHKDEDKTNNRADNLEWCDRSYNNQYGSRDGATRGCNNPMNKFDEDVVREIKRTYIPGDMERGVTGLANKYGISQTHVCAIIKGRRWGWLE